MMNKFGKQLGDFLEFSNISINEFAERIDITPKHLIDIIKGDAPLTQYMIYNISFVTGISTQYIENVEEGYRVQKMVDEFLNENSISLTQFVNSFNYKELADKYGVEYTNERNKYHIVEDILKYLRISDPKLIYKKDNSIFYKSKNDRPELLALWLERCYRMTRTQEIGEYTKDNIINLVEFIRDEARNNRFDKERLIKEFNKNGIFLAIEPDLKGSKIRGAFKVLNNKPAIYLTTKHKRIGDVYFALLHELAHCKSDFNRAKSGSIVSNINDIELEEYEIRADKTALNWMIPDDEYTLVSPVDEWKQKTIKNYNVEELQVPIFVDGELVYEDSTIDEKRERVKQQMKSLYPEIKRLENPQEYIVDLSIPLLKLKRQMIKNHTYRDVKGKALVKIDE